MTKGIVQSALDFIEHNDKYYINNYSFGVQTLTDLAKNGLDARMRLIHAGDHIKKLIEEIDQLKAQLNEKESL
jgi:hypothetical protein